MEHLQIMPSAVERLTRSNALRLSYPESQKQLSAEFLRVHSPSAEVRQHGHPILVSGKAKVRLIKISLIGRYGVKLFFDDGHDTGIYTWAYLHQLCAQEQQLWDDYLQKLHDAHQSREPEAQVVQIQMPK